MPTIEELRQSMMSAQMSARGQYFPLGLYICQLKSLFYKVSSDGTRKEQIIAEFTVLESSNPEVKVGSTRGERFGFELQGNEGRFKTLVMALVGLDDKDPRCMDPGAQQYVADLYVALILKSEQLAAFLQPLIGKVVKGEGVPVHTKKGKDIVGMRWSPYVQPVAA